MSKALVAFGSLIAALGSVAAPVTVEQARTAVGNWLRDDPALGCRLGAAVDSARTCTPSGNAKFHVVKLSGGGFVVTSADTKIEPVIAFSDSSDLVESDDNPLWVLLTRDMSARTDAISSGGGALLQSVSPGASEPTEAERKWSKLLGGSRVSLQGAVPSAGNTTVSDLRVAPLVQSKWGQENNSVYSNWGSPCYNCYTPNNYPCGCVATAMAQLMRYHGYPTSVTAVSRNCAVNGVQKRYTMKGGTYDYANMPLVPEAYSGMSWYVGGATVSQREAIGKLTYDCGVAMQMNWKEDASGAGGGAAHGPLKEVFHYANAHTAVNGLDDAAYRNRVICPNLDAGYPVMLGVSGSAGGHEIIADGYGYSGNVLYTHLNMGWSGSDDAWYALPNIPGSLYAANSVKHAIFNVFPDRTGEIVSGRVVSSGGDPVVGATVTIKRNGSTVETKTTDAHGIFAFVVAAGRTYTVEATSQGAQVQTSASVTASGDSSVIFNVGGYSYYDEPAPNCGNVMCGDLVLSSLASVSMPQFSPDACLFYPSTNVTIACATSGATIHYTTDGSDPTESSPVYSGAIRVSDDMTLKARAYKTGMNPSAIAIAVYTYDAAQGAPKGDYFDNPIEITGASGSRVIDSMELYSLEANEPQHTLFNNRYSMEYHSSWYVWTAPGSGTMSFTTRCVGSYLYPNAVAVYDGNALTSLTRLAMSKDYSSSGNYSTTVTLAVEQGKTYRIAGVVLYDLNGDNAEFRLSWSGSLVETPTATSTTPVPVPYVWLDGRFSGTHTTAQYESLAQADQDGDGFPTWQEYVLDTDPNDAASRLTASIRMEGSTPVAEWSHTNANIEALGYRYVPKGRVSLTSGTWSDFNPANHHFIKIIVEAK